jgi:AbrB family looped-hinge helix DNA binding protein
MKTTIDNAGRLVIPKEIRRQAGLHAGDQLNVSWRDGRIEIEPAALPVKLVRRGRWLVAVAEHPVPKLTQDEVNATLDAIRAERGAIDE